MRLDKFLKVSRLIKRRTVANDISSSGRILVNKHSAKPSKQLKIDDIITIEGVRSSITVKVLEIPQNNVPTQLAATLYEVVEEKI